MRGILLEALFQTPSVSRFLNRLLYDLSARRSVLVLLPHGVEAIDIWSRLETRLWQQDFYLRIVSLPELPTAPAPAAVLGDALGVEWPSANAPRTTENLSLAKGMPEVLYLEGLAQVSPAAQQVWLSWLSAWALASHSAADRGETGTAVLALAPAPAVLSHMPESEPRLAIHWWWGFPSALEMQLLCRFGGTEESDTRTLWREHVLPALAGSNTLLAAHLWDDLFEDTSHLLARLLSFGEMCRWTKKQLRTLGAERLASFPNATDSPSSSPPPRWRELWACGAVGRTPEYGLELDTAALATLGRTDEVMHRVWRGQANLMLPLIDQTRLAICDDLTQRFGPDWPLRWSSPVSPEEREELKQSPFACGWGYLEWLLRDCPYLRSERRWLPLCSVARHARNELAHYHPLEFRDFEGLWREIGHVVQSEPRYA